jgi:hypothetical protein
MHTVEIRRFRERVSGAMAEMRTWFDHHRIQPTLIQISFHPGKETRFRLTFGSAREAHDFAQAFNAEVLSDGNSSDIAA